MSLSIYIIGIVIVFLLSLIYYHRTIKHDYMVIFIIGYIWMLLMSNNKGDNITYNYSYLAAKYGNRDFIDFTDLLYGKLCILCSSLGLSFWQFKGLLMIISLVLLYWGIRNYTANIEFFYFLYLISFVFMDSQVMRNYVSASIFLFSIKFLQNRSIKNIILFGICLFVMSGIHSAFIVFAICFVIFLDNREKIAKVLFGTGAILTFFAYFGDNKMTLFKLIAGMFINDTRMIFFDSKTRLGALPVIVLYYFAIWLMWEFSIKKKMEIPEFKKGIVYTAFLIFLCMGIALPLVVLNLTFYRIIKNITLLCYCIMATTYMKMKYLNSRVTIMLFSIVLAVGWLIFETVIYGSYETVVDPVINGVLYWDL